jgi:hypothetical protein
MLCILFPILSPLPFPCRWLLGLYLFKGVFVVIMLEEYDKKGYNAHYSCEPEKQTQTDAYISKYR